MANDKMVYVDGWTHEYLRSIRGPGESIGSAAKRVSEFFRDNSGKVEKLEEENRELKMWMNQEEF